MFHSSTADAHILRARRQILKAHTASGISTKVASCWPDEVAACLLMRSLSKRLLALFVLPIFGVALACSSDDTKIGRYQVYVHGQDGVEQGMPATSFADGWALTFDHFYVSIGDIGVSSAKNQELVIVSPSVMDLKTPSFGRGQLLLDTYVEQDDYTHLRYSLASALPNNSLVADPTVAPAMGEQGLTVWMQGVAQKDGKVVRFDWKFATKRDFVGCEAIATVNDAAPAIATLSIHADQIFRDALGNALAPARFDLIAAADTNLDGEVTQLELAAVDIRGRQEYQVGPRIDVVDLGSFLAAQIESIGRVNGDAACISQPRAAT